MDISNSEFCLFMDSLFPCIIDGKLYDGLLFQSKECCHVCDKQCVANASVVSGKMCHCDRDVFIRSNSSSICYVGLEEAVRSIGYQNVTHGIWFEDAFREWEKIKHEMTNNLEEYDRILRRMWDVLLPVVNTVDYSGGSNVITMDRKFVEHINNGVRELRFVVSKANERINAFDLKSLSIPRPIVKYVAEYGIEPSWTTKNGGIHISLGDLHQLTQRMNSADRRLVSSNVVNNIKALRKEVIKIRRQIFAFNEWVHDLGHYMVRLDNVLPSGLQRQMIANNLHTIDALLTEVSLLKVELNERIGSKLFGNIYPRYKNRKTYEPYKVFHRHRFCYGDIVRWVGDKREFRRRAEFVKWVDFIAMNLYSNAIKYLKNYPGDKEVSTTFTQSDIGVEITVQSYGPPVNGDELATLGLHRGTRAKSANAYPGHGYGLYRVRNVCNAAGYKVWFTSDSAQSQYQGFALFGAHILIPEQCFID